jgi:hypothetical protein
MQLNNFALLAPLTLIVEREIKSLETLLPFLSQDWQVISIGQALSTYIVTANEIDRSRMMRQWLDDNLRDKAPGPVVCTDIDLLFHPFFELDPLALFRQISRHTKLIILWPGTFKDGVLSYAQSEHNHYRFWRNPEGVDIKGVLDALP